MKVFVPNTASETSVPLELIKPPLRDLTISEVERFSPYVKKGEPIPWKIIIPWDKKKVISGLHYVENDFYTKWALWWKILEFSTITHPMETLYPWEIERVEILEKQHTETGCVASLLVYPSEVLCEEVEKEEWKLWGGLLEKLPKELLNKILSTPSIIQTLNEAKGFTTIEVPFARKTVRVSLPSCLGRAPKDRVLKLLDFSFSPWRDVKKLTNAKGELTYVTTRSGSFADIRDFYWLKRDYLIYEVTFEDTVTLTLDAKNPEIGPVRSRVEVTEERRRQLIDLFEWTCYPDRGIFA